MKIFLSEAAGDMEKKPSLMEQKKLQWAKEKEELNGLWSPWGRPTECDVVPLHPVPILSPSYISKLGIQQSESCHLPPIRGSHEGKGKTSFWHSEEKGKEVSSPERNKKNKIDSLLKRNNSSDNSLNSNPKTVATEEDTSGYQSSEPTVVIKKPPGNSNPSPKGKKSPIKNSKKSEVTLTKVDTSTNTSANVHLEHRDCCIKSKIEKESSLNGIESKPNNKYEEKGTSPVNILIFNEPESEGMKREGVSLKISPRALALVENGMLHEEEIAKVIVHKILHSEEIKRNWTEKKVYNENVRDNFYMHSPAESEKMKKHQMSTFTFTSKAEEVEAYKLQQKKDREEWLMELEKQREEQRARRAMEREEKRPKWGDRGIGVGHFWEPTSMGLNSRLPNHDTKQGEMKNPAWLEKRISLENSLIDARSIGDSERENLESRGFVRGHPASLDPDFLAEREKKRVAAIEHQQAIRKQMEERQNRIKEERMRKEEAEKLEEARVENERQKELQIFEREHGGVWRSSKREESRVNKISARSGLNSYEVEEIRTEYLESRQRLLIDSTRMKQLREKDGFLPPIGMQRLSPTISLASTSTFFDEPSKLHHSYNNIDKMDQGLMTEQSDYSQSQPRLLTPTRMRRSRSLSNNREFGTQTDVESRRLRNEKNNSRSQNSLIEKCSSDKENKLKCPNKKEEKPRWGATPAKICYKKQSEKDPFYSQRMKRRAERLKRRELLQRAQETGTESEDLYKPPRKKESPKKHEPLKAFLHNYDPIYDYEYVNDEFEEEEEEELMKLASIPSSRKDSPMSKKENLFPDSTKRPDTPINNHKENDHPSMINFRLNSLNSLLPFEDDFNRKQKENSIRSAPEGRSRRDGSSKKKKSRFNSEPKIKPCKDYYYEQETHYTREETMLEMNKFEEYVDPYASPPVPALLNKILHGSREMSESEEENAECIKILQTNDPKIEIANTNTNKTNEVEPINQNKDKININNTNDDDDEINVSKEENKDDTYELMNQTGENEDEETKEENESKGDYLLIKQREEDDEEEEQEESEEENLENPKIENIRNEEEIDEGIVISSSQISPESSNTALSAVSSGLELFEPEFEINPNPSATYDDFDELLHYNSSVVYAKMNSLFNSEDRVVRKGNKFRSPSSTFYIPPPIPLLIDGETVMNYPTYEDLISPRNKEKEIRRREKALRDANKINEETDPRPILSSRGSEKGILELSIPNLEGSEGEETSQDEGSYYVEPSLSERDRATIKWLYSNDPQETPKQNFLHHLAYLKKGIVEQRREWGLSSDTDNESSTTTQPSSIKSYNLV